MMLFHDAALMEPHRLVHPSAWLGHIPFASWLMAVLRPDVVVELGTFTGNSYSAFCQAITENKLATRAYAVDTWRGDEHNGMYDENVFLDLQKYHDPLYGSFSTLLRLTFDEAAGRFPEGSIDVLHIDGLHTYEAVKHDFETWLPRVSKRGVVLFHDTNVYEGSFGVHTFWAEARRQYPGFDFRHSHGLGVLLVGEQRQRELLELAESTPSNQKLESLSRLFRVLGDAIERRLQLEDLRQVVRDRDKWIGLFHVEVADRDAHIVNYNRFLAERDAHIAGLKQALAERDAQIATLNEVVKVHRSTISWRITKPFRLFGR
jgi:hypothetical protein